MSEEAGHEERGDASRTRAKWLGVLLILVALGAAVYEAREFSEDMLPLATAPQGERGRLPSLSEMLASVDAQRYELPARTVQALPPSAFAEAASAPPLAPGESEVCGFGRVKDGTPGVEQTMRRMEASTKPPRNEVQKALLASTDEVDRAVGLYLQGAAYQQVWAVQESASDAERAQQEGMDRGALDSLARMAVTTRSPQVYALALKACDARKHDGVCQMLSTEQWIRLDPSNAAPWIRALDDARRSRDPGGTSEAVHRIGQATRVDGYSDTILKAATRHVPRDLPLPQRFATVMEYFGQTASIEPSYAGLIEHCSAAAVRDSNRLQSCAAVAEALVANARSLVALSAGFSIGERVGWPAQRVQKFKDERETVNLAFEGYRDMSCRSVAKQMRVFDAWPLVGELNALRAQAKELPPEVVATARGRWEEREAKRAAAASAPSLN